MSEFNAPPPSPPATGLFSDQKNVIIVVLLVIVVLAFVGVNLLTFSGNLLEDAGEIFGPVIKNFLSMVGLSTGELIKRTSDVAAEGANLGVDIAKGTSHSIGDLLINASKGGMDEEQRKTLQQALNMPRCAKESPPTPPASAAASAPSSSSASTSAPAEPEPTPTTDPIVAQNLKSNWCYVGDFNGTRGCVEFNGTNTCASGQVFPNQAACLAPGKV